MRMLNSNNDNQKSKYYLTCLLLILSFIMEVEFLRVILIMVDAKTCLDEYNNQVSVSMGIFICEVVVIILYGSTILLTLFMKYINLENNKYLILEVLVITIVISKIIVLSIFWLPIENYICYNDPTILIKE